MVVVDNLAPEIEFRSAVGNGAHPSTNTYSSGAHTVAFAFDDDVPAGASGQLQVVARFAPEGEIPNGFAAQNTADVSTTNGSPSSSDPAQITAIATSD